MPGSASTSRRRFSPVPAGPFATPASAPRSGFESTYLSAIQLDAAADAWALERSASESSHIFGELVEQLYAEVIGGRWRKATTRDEFDDEFEAECCKPNAHAADVIGPHGERLQVKTRKLTARRGAPTGLDRVGERVLIEVARVKPKGLRCPVESATATEIGRGVLAAFNEAVAPQWDEIALFLPLNCPSLAAEQVLHWREPVAPLEGRWLWRDSEAAARSEDSDRSVHGWFVPKGCTRVPARSCDASWCSSGQLRLRLTIPEDADIIHVGHHLMLDREAKKRCLRRGIAEQREAVLGATSGLPRLAA